MRKSLVVLALLGIILSTGFSAHPVSAQEVKAQAFIGGAESIGNNGLYHFSAGIIYLTGDDFGTLNYTVKVEYCPNRVITMHYNNAEQSISFPVAPKGRICHGQVKLSVTVDTANEGSFTATRTVKVVKNTFTYQIDGPASVHVGEQANFQLLPSLSCEEPEDSGGTVVDVLNMRGQVVATFESEHFATLSFTPGQELKGNWKLRWDAYCLVTDPTGWPHYTVYNRTQTIKFKVKP